VEGVFGSGRGREAPRALTSAACLARSEDRARLCLSPIRIQRSGIDPVWWTPCVSRRGAADAKNTSTTISFLVTRVPGALISTIRRSKARPPSSTGCRSTINLRACGSTRDRPNRMTACSRLVLAGWCSVGPSGASLVRGLSRHQ
jgi:hypothetical protein